MKAIMYHYVRPHDVNLPKLKYLHIEDFCKQLDFFDKNYGFISKETFYSCLTRKDNTRQEGIILTFDDGLACHYHYVYPELKKRGLWGIFYVPTGIYIKQKLLDVHRTHVILAACDEKLVFDKLQPRIKDSMLIDENRTEFQQETYKMQSDNDYTKLIKRILNYYIDYQFREQILDDLVMDLNLQYLCQVDDFYINDEQMTEINESGMIIGSHSISHPVMSKLSYAEQQQEIQQSFARLVPYIDSHWKTFCYPYGGKHSYTNETIQLLEQEECLFSFDVCSRDVTVKDIMYSPQTLPRYDCNEFPYGKVRELAI